jgi:hypothetical protein
LVLDKGKAPHGVFPTLVVQKGCPKKKGPENDTAVTTVADVVGRAVADALMCYFPDASTDGLGEVRAVQSWADDK